MTDRSSLRLVVLQVLVVSLLLTLVGRLWYMQVITPAPAQEQVTANSQVQIFTPAVRGLILDDKGRPFAINRQSIVITVDPVVLAKRPDQGRTVLHRLAKIIGTSYTDLFNRTRRCGTDKDAKPPECWNGSPFQPIPVATDVTTEVALSVSEERERFLDRRERGRRTDPPLLRGRGDMRQFRHALDRDEAREFLKLLVQLHADLRRAGDELRRALHVGHALRQHVLHGHVVEVVEPEVRDLP